MSYSAKVFNVMIVSPGDVASERSIIRDVIYEWNAVHSFSRNIVLMPVGWESHSSPEMGNSPQDIINKQILEKCDLLVGVFWTRIGTATENYASGTVEEIENHIESKKPAMLYFSGQPVVMDSVDIDQYSKLKEFKTSCQKRGLYEEYDSLSDFKEKFYRHLQIKLNQHSLFNDINSETTKENHLHINMNNLLSTDNILETKTPLPPLSNEGRILLKEASLDPHGTILYIRHLGGTDLQTNGKNLVQTKDRREVAKWESALQKLLDNDLVVDRGHKGEIFEISNLGYQIADMIEL